MYKLIPTCLIVFLIIISSNAQNPNLGTAGAQFLKIPVGAKAAALGGSVTGFNGEALTMFWNPAGLTGVSQNSAHFSYMRWFDMFDFNAAGFARNFGPLGVFGFGVIVFSTDEMEVTTENDPNGTGRYFDARDLALSLSYARKLTNRFSAGISAKYIYQRIWNETANGFAFDVGSQFSVDFQNTIIAMSMSNFGPDLRLSGADLNIKYDGDAMYPNRLLPATYETETYPLPLNFQFGVSFDLVQQRFLKIRGAVDAVHPNDNDERLQFGMEAAVFDILMLRAGLKMKHDDEDANFGLGFQRQLGHYLVKLDYGYSLYSVLPDVHFISAGFDF
jgi:hypothetical protein